MHYISKKRHVIALLSAMSSLGAGYVHAQVTPVNVGINQPTYWAGNSSDTFVETLASPLLNAADIEPSDVQANALQATFDAAVAGLNDNADELGSAANYQAARAALDADPTNVELQENLARSQARYSSFNTTITNLSAAATVGEGVTIASFTGVSGDELTSATLAVSGGAIATARETAAESTAAISDAVSYYAQGAGASTSAESFADLEGGVISRIQEVPAATVGLGALEYDENGFRNQEMTAFNAASLALADAQQEYSDAIAEGSGATPGDIAAAAGALAAAEQTFANSVTALYDTFAPITNESKDNLMAAVLNGSWERDAIKSLSADSVAAADAINEINTNGIDGIIEKKADGSIHIGENSLITNEVGGVQQLYAQDGGGAAINIDVTNGSDLLVNGVSVATDADVTNEANIRAAADVVLQNNINAEATTRAAADVVLQNNINAEAATRAAADVVLQNNINAEAATRAAADVVLQNNINAEAATRAAADTTLQANIDAEATTRAAADTVLGQRIDTLDTRVTTQVARLDGAISALDGRTSALEGRMGQAERDIRSLRKGVAMAAALQTPVIERGDKMAVKVGAATYDGEQGLGLGYAVRVGDKVTVNVDVATGFPETVARGGVNLSF